MCFVEKLGNCYLDIILNDRAEKIILNFIFSISIKKLYNNWEKYILLSKFKV